MAVPSVTGHDPDSVGWLTNPWPTWDGVTTIDPCTSTKQQILAFIWPNNQWQMRGLRELFYSNVPFADNTAPTPREIELWHEKVISHYRDLLGKPYPATGSRELYLRSFFNDQRKFSTYWDIDYPGTCGSAYGPCVSCGTHSNTHCGGTFVPSPADQEPYLLPGESSVVSSGGGAEGIFLYENDWPWCLLLSRVLRGIVAGEGITGHGGPFATRPFFGISFRCPETGTTAALRMKWNGTQNIICP
jgi:hypothetical protein